MVDIGKKTKKIAEKLAELEDFATVRENLVGESDVIQFIRGYNAGMIHVIDDIKRILENKKDAD